MGDVDAPELDADVDAPPAAEELFQVWEDEYGDLEEEMVTSWERRDEKYRHAKEYGDEGSVGCMVADPGQKGCPILYATQGLADLTGQPRGDFLNRSLLDLQEPDLDANKEEMDRLKDFCEVPMSGSRLLLLTLCKSPSGEVFWSLFSLVNMRFEGRSKKSPSYILAIQHRVVIHRTVMTMLLECMSGNEWCLGHLEKLRATLREHEASFSPLKQSPLALMLSCLDKWVLESIGPEIEHFWEGTHYVPIVGETGTDALMGRWPLVMSTTQNMIKKLFQVCDTVLEDTLQNKRGSIVCAVSDPTRMDCPLVYVSKAFEDMTGYECSFAVGRNCRFLQPKIIDVNRNVNDDEMARMRAFCTKPMASQSTILNLLLNETINGDRFWNFLFMRHVIIDGHPYIFAVQTILDLPMPRVLRNAALTKLVFDYDECFFDSFLANTRKFLRGLRETIRRVEHSEKDGMLANLAAESKEQINGFLHDFGDEYEGDHYVPRTCLKEAIEFETQGTRRQMEQVVQKELADLGEMVENNLAYTITDLQLEDQPLVYVSRSFEKLTGYSHEWSLGRNTRFLLPNNATKSEAFNDTELARMGEFCSLPQKPGRFVTLLVNETRGRCLFWNLVVMQYLEFDGKLYLVAVNTSLAAQRWKTVELLGLDADTGFEIERLRRIVGELAPRLGAEGPEGLTLSRLGERAIMTWQSGITPGLLMQRVALSTAEVHGHGHGDAGSSPGTQASGSTDKQEVHIPLVGVEIFTTMTKPDMQRLVADALEEGIRHFQVTPPPPCSEQGKAQRDGEYQDLEALHCSLKLAEVLQDLKSCNLQFLKPAIVFSIKTPPRGVLGAEKIIHAINRTGSSVACWFLDVSRCGPDKAMTLSWEKMAKIAAAVGVPTLGLAGACAEKMLKVMDMCKGCKVSALLMHDHPHKLDNARANEVYASEKLMSMGSARLTLMGQIDSLFLPAQEQIHKAADILGVDPSIMLTKWAQTKGYSAVMLPKLRISDKGLHNEEERTNLLTTVHRTFVRQYHQAPKLDSVVELLSLQREVQETSDEVARESSQHSTTTSLAGALLRRNPGSPDMRAAMRSASLRRRPSDAGAADTKLVPRRPRLSPHASLRSLRSSLSGLSDIPDQDDPRGKLSPLMTKRRSQPTRMSSKKSLGDNLGSPRLSMSDLLLGDRLGSPAVSLSDKLGSPRPSQHESPEASDQAIRAAIASWRKLRSHSVGWRRYSTDSLDAGPQTHRHSRSSHSSSKDHPSELVVPAAPPSGRPGRRITVDELFVPRESSKEPPDEFLVPAPPSSRRSGQQRPDFRKTSSCKRASNTEAEDLQGASAVRLVYGGGAREKRLPPLDPDGWVI